MLYHVYFGVLKDDLNVPLENSKVYWKLCVCTLGVLVLYVCGCDRIFSSRGTLYLVKNLNMYKSVEC